MSSVPSLSQLLATTRNQFATGSRTGTTLFGSAEITPDPRIGPKFFATITPTDVRRINENFVNISNLITPKPGEIPQQTTFTPQTAAAEQGPGAAKPSIQNSIGTGFNQIVSSIGIGGVIIGGVILAVLLLRKR